MEPVSAVCKNCNLPVLPEFYFCPNCGKQLREKSLTVSVLTQIGVYLLSFFLPPFGLYPGIKYLKQSDPKTKLIGWIAVALTLISIGLSIFIFAGFMQQVSQTLNQLGTGNFTGF